jgi:hypothetical protein
VGGGGGGGRLSARARGIHASPHPPAMSTRWSLERPTHVVAALVAADGAAAVRLLRSAGGSDGERVVHGFGRARVTRSDCGKRGGATRSGAPVVGAGGAHGPTASCGCLRWTQTSLLAWRRAPAAARAVAPVSDAIWPGGRWSALPQFAPAGARGTTTIAPHGGTCASLPDQTLTSGTGRYGSLVLRVGGGRRCVAHSWLRCDAGCPAAWKTGSRGRQKTGTMWRKL